MKQRIVPDTVVLRPKVSDIIWGMEVIGTYMHNTGLWNHAREVTSRQMKMAQMPAAAGGMFSNKLFGNLAKPSPAMIVGRYQLSA